MRDDCHKPVSWFSTLAMHAIVREHTAPSRCARVRAFSSSLGDARMSCSQVRRARTSVSVLIALYLSLLTMALTLASVRAGAQTQTSTGGASAAAIQATVDAFRTSLGPLNANVAGSFGSGRREINWDGVPDALAAPNNLPANFFNVNSPRGVVFSTPGTGFAVSANASSGTPTRFGNIDASYSTIFNSFSAERLFTAIGSNVVDVNFFIAGSASSAFTSGFGVVFSDVDLASTTSLQFFDDANVSLGSFNAPVGLFSFLGVTFGSAVVRRVRITSGNTALASGATDQNGNSRDVVAMDDFIYGETVARESVVPEPSTYSLFAAGLLAVTFMRRRRRG